MKELSIQFDKLILLNTETAGDLNVQLGHVLIAYLRLARRRALNCMLTMADAVLREVVCIGHWTKPILAVVSSQFLLEHDVNVPIVCVASIRSRYRACPRGNVLQQLNDFVSGAPASLMSSYFGQSDQSTGPNAGRVYSSSIMYDLVKTT